MEAPKALLIQGVSDYLAILKEALTPFLGSFGGPGYRLETVLEWIIREEIEIVYHLFPDNHYRTLTYFYDHVRNYYGGNLSMYTAAYIKAPVVFQDSRNISVSLVKGDLYIWYYAAPTPIPRLIRI